MEIAIATADFDFYRYPLMLRGTIGFKSSKDCADS